MGLKPLCMLTLASAAAMIPFLALCQASAPDDLIMAAKHEKWMSEFNRTYKDEAEKAMRFKVFKENAAYIEAFNRQARMTYKLGLNKFSDLTNQEFLARHTGYVSGRRSTMKSSSSFKYAEAADLPESIDWNRKGAVTLVKDMGECGCCWAFSAIGALEGFYEIKTEELIVFSEQELLDCAAEANQGCNGGYSPGSAFQYILDKNGTMTTGTDYTYQAFQGDTCRSANFSRFNVFMDDLKIVPSNNEPALMAAVAMQPVSVEIDGGDPSFRFYKGGIYNGPCGTDLNHAVTVVGYGVDSSDGTKYWLLKNSWGYNWGEDGYMKLQKDVAAAEGLCGIAMEASYPTQDLEQISP